MGSDSTTADVGMDETGDDGSGDEQTIQNTKSRKHTKRTSFMRAVEDIQMDIATHVNSTKRNMTAGFINIEQRASRVEKATGLAAVRKNVAGFMQSPWTDTILGCIICLDVILAWVELDMNSAGDATPPWMSTLIGICFGVYVIELVLNIFTQRSIAFRDPWIHLDSVIVLGGTADYVIQTGGVSIGFVSIVRVFRIFRIVRLLRVLRKFSTLKELRKLVAMSASCACTLFWSFTFAFILMMVWGMFTVSLVAPVARELRDSGGYEDCPDCADQMSSVLRATLLYFKLAVVGDQWGMVVEPLMFYDPSVGLVFIGGVLSIIFGVLNLVVAVVVDEFAERRANDFMAKAQELDDELRKDEIRLKKIFKMVDENDDGELSLEELVAGAKRVPEFRNRLRAMDIDEADVKQLFAMLDDDHSGTIDPSEFLGTLSRWLHESSTASRFVKYQTENIMEMQGSMKEMMVSLFELVHSRLTKLQDTSQKMTKAFDARAPEKGDLFSEVGCPAGPVILQPIMPTIPDDIGSPSVPRSHDSRNWRRANKDDASSKALQKALHKASEAIAESLKAAQVSFEWKESPLASGTSNSRSAHDSSLGAELKICSFPGQNSLMDGAPTVRKAQDSPKAGAPVRSLNVQWQGLPEDTKNLHVIT